LLRVGRLLFSKLNRLKMILNSFVFARFRGTVRRVHSATCLLDENRINTQARALGTHECDYITNRDRPLVCTLPEMPGSNGIGPNFVEDLALTLPRRKERSRLRNNRPCKRGFPVVHLRPMDGLIVQNFL